MAPEGKVHLDRGDLADLIRIEACRQKRREVRREIWDPKITFRGVDRIVVPRGWADQADQVGLGAAMSKIKPKRDL